jgi:ABC-type Co2+ transport system permease subunit
MTGEYSLAKVDLLLALAVVRLGRHDGGYVIGVVLIGCMGLLALRGSKVRGANVCRRWRVGARCGWATLMLELGFCNGEGGDGCCS